MRRKPRRIHLFVALATLSALLAASTLAARPSQTRNQGKGKAEKKQQQQNTRSTEEDAEPAEPPSEQPAPPEPPTILELCQSVHSGALENAATLVERLNSASKEDLETSELLESQSALQLWLDAIDEHTSEAIDDHRSETGQLRLVLREQLHNHHAKEIHSCRDLKDPDTALEKVDSILHDLLRVKNPELLARARLIHARILHQSGRYKECHDSLLDLSRNYHGKGRQHLDGLCSEPALELLPLERFDELYDTFVGDSLGFVDLQPAELISKVRIGEVAEGQFILTNPTSSTLSIPVTIRGAVQEALPANGEWRLEGLPNIRQTVLQRTFKIDAGEDVVILLEAPLFQYTSEHAVTIMTPSQTSIWRYGTHRGDAPEVEATDAVYTQLNPFYNVPVAHTIYHRGHSKQPANFRLIANMVVTLEIRDTATDTVLAIDAEGDGDYTGPYDELNIDTDFDGFPDIGTETFRTHSHIEVTLRTFERTAFNQREINLSLQVLDQAQWYEDALDVVLLP